MTYIKSHAKPIGLLLATLYMALRPEIFDGASWDLKQWLGFGLFALGTVQAFAYANTTATVAQYTKEFVVVVSAGMGALVTALPGGVSRSDLGVIIAAVAAAVWSFVAPPAPKAVLPGPHRMGDSVR